MSAELRNLYAALPRTTRGEALVLHGKADKDTFLYTHASSVFIRNLSDPAVCDAYSDHGHQTTVAKYSPSGFYIASADVTGKVRIWDTVNPEHITKNEFQPFAGPVKDLDWSGDSQRMICGGQGKEKFSHVFSADTGTSVGDLLGHSKFVNSVSFKPNRPFRVISGSEDRTACYYEGPPFKLKKCLDDHTNFVNCVRYADDGSKFVTASSDGRIHVYDGKTAEKIGELGDPAHKGGVYSVCFSPSSYELLSVSGDKTAKVWNMETESVVCEFVMGKAIEDMQLGCIWIGKHLITVSLSGHINFLDRENPATPSRIVKGHNKPIMAMVCSESTIYTGDGGGKICAWDAETGTCENVSGSGHTAQVNSLSLCGESLSSCGIDDTVKTVDLSSLSFSDGETKMNSQPAAVATGSNGFTVVACINHLVVLQGGNVTFSLDVKYEPTSVAMNPDQTEVAVGSSKDNNVRIYSLNSGTLTELKVLPQSGSIMTVSYSPDGSHLATGNSNRKVSVYSCPDYEVVVGDEWTSHGAKVLSVAWSPNSQYIASGGIDANVFVWSLANRGKKIKIDRAHKMSAVSSVSWRTNNILVSAGVDSIIKQWNITHH